MIDHTDTVFFNNSSMVKGHGPIISTVNEEISRCTGKQVQFGSDYTYYNSY